jgi:2-oxoisovalerate dehydrogenase E2 component (dihydrolipoyl transacylase)
MSTYIFKVPDLGEGTVTSEIVAWHVRVGDTVAEDAPLVEMATEKAVVEVTAPVSGRIVALHGELGDSVAVGSPLVVFETASAAGLSAGQESDSTSVTAIAAAVPVAETGVAVSSGRVRASPATRRRAREAGVNLTSIVGTGPGGRIEAHDLGAAAAAPWTKSSIQSSGPASTPAAGTQEIKVVGVRRVIANRLSESARTIPHFAYVEEVDVTLLEAVRQRLNASASSGAAPLTYLPFIVAALTRALAQYPQCNAQYDTERNVIVRHSAVHVGIATQTPDGLKVPVIRHAEQLDVRALAAQIARVADSARRGTCTRAELTGSTITVTSLGKLGGIASTPIINLPEVAIIGINKALDRPMVVNGAVVIRRMMNLSSSFDHRFVDGYDGAALIQAVKALLEQPEQLLPLDD